MCLVNLDSSAEFAFHSVFLQPRNSVVLRHLPPRPKQLSHQLHEFNEVMLVEGSVQNLSHFKSCDGGSVMLKFHLAQRLHVHILSRAPLRAGDVFQPGRSQAKTDFSCNRIPPCP